MAQIGPETLIARGTEHVETQMGGQTVMMSIPRGKYFALGGTAQRIWECLAEPLTVRQIVDRLAAEYDIDAAECEAEVIAFVRELAENGLAVEHGG